MSVRGCPSYAFTLGVNSSAPGLFTRISASKVGGTAHAVSTWGFLHSMGATDRAHHSGYWEIAGACQLSKQSSVSFSDESVEYGVELFAALAHPVRLRVLLEVNALGSATVGELVERLGVEQSSLSHQLAILRKARLLQSEVDGKSRIYKLVDKHVSHIVEDAIIHTQEKPPEE